MAAEMKTIQCREHGGTFQIESRRGRPPVRCNEDNPCTGPIKMTVSKRRLAEAAAQLPSAKTARAPKVTATQALNRAKRDYAAIVESDPPAEAPRRTRKAPVKAAPVTTTVNPSIPLALAARKRLEPLGWHCEGRALPENGARVTATRGDETLIFVFRDGLVTQSYVYWNLTKPSENGAPDSSLPFDPNEMTDGELVRAISGMRITWWNSLARAERSAIVSPGKVQIEHTFSGDGIEAPGMRIVKFIEMESGFCAFHVDALLRVGK